jgi:hypothetical protein
VAVLGPGSLFGNDLTETGAPTKIDSAFTNKFAELKEAAGFIEQPAADARNEWRPNLQLWMGVKAVEGKKQTIYFVQLTTLATPQTNIWGEPWQPTLRTNNWSWRGTNKNAAPKRAEYVNSLYPVRARVFDADGRALKEGNTQMTWGMSTNGLLDMCRLSLELIPSDAPTNEPVANLPESENDRIMATVGGGFLWMMQMFGDLQTVPSVADVWEKAQCAIRMPAWTMIKGILTGFSINLQPRLADVTKIESAGENDAAGLYRLPIELRSRRDKLSDVEIIIGPPRGAEMLLSGIRSIRAVHPTKPQREFLTQVLATGSCPEDK